MRTITLVTGNPGKLLEWQRIFPKTYKLRTTDLDLIEIQSLDPLEVAEDKARRAFAHVGEPVVVDDIAAGLDHLEGLPGTFMKFFEEKMGRDALYRLAGSKEARCTLTAVAAYHDGVRSVSGVGKLKGKIISPRGGEGFGFDFVFVPDGHNKTFSEMGPDEKDKISHRTLAIQDLVRQLNDL